MNINTLKKSLLFIAISTLTFAQTTNISGSVKGDDGNALPAANLVVKGTTSGTMTDMDGKFFLNLTEADMSASEGKLMISYIGYKSKTVTITDDQSNYDIVLEKDILGLSEVVVTGMVGAREKTKTPYAISSLNKEQLQKAPALSAESAIRGKVAGAKVVQGSGLPGSAASVQLRGATSIDASGRSQNPLFIIDGVILSSDANMGDIDASDIESIEIVKGAAGASLYGARAAQGVVQIKTSRGKDLGFNQTRINYRAEYGTNELPKKIETVKYHYNLQSLTSYSDSSGHAVVPGDYISASGQWIDPRDRFGGRVPDYFGDPVNGIYFQDNEYRYVETGVPANAGGSAEPTLLKEGGFDNLDLFFNPGIFKTNTLSISHNAPSTNFYTSFKNTNVPGVMYNKDGYERNSLRINLDHNLADRLKFSASTYFSQSNSDEPRESVGSPFFRLTFMNPSLDLLMIDDQNYEKEAIGGPWNDTYDQIFITPDPFNPSNKNPMYDELYHDIFEEKNRYLTNLSLTYTPLSWMSVQSNFSLDQSKADYMTRIQHGTKSHIGEALHNGWVYHTKASTEAINYDVTGSFNQSFNDLALRGKLRYLYESDKYDDLYAEGREFASKGIYSLGAATEGMQVDSYEDQILSEGYFAIGGIDYKDRYILDMLFRKDGSSLFGENERWQNYYRVSSAWRLSEEAFWSPLKGTVNEAKFRFSKGTAGNRPSFAAQYETYNVSGGIISKQNLGNKDLLPEFSTETELGFDFSIMNKYSVQITQATSIIENQILLVPLQGFYGYESQWKNAGTLTSKTLELSLQAVLMSNRDMQWTANVLYDKSTSEITEFDLPPYLWSPEESWWAFPVFMNQTGELLGNLYGHKFIRDLDDLPSHVEKSEFDINDDGYVVWVGSGNNYEMGISDNLWGGSTTLYSSDSSSSSSYNWGRPIIYSEEDGNDIVNIGTTNPDFNYAFGTDFRFKGLSVYLLFEGQKGGNIYNFTRQWAFRDHASPEDNQGDKKDSEKKPTVYYDDLYDVAGPNSHFVEDASYLKLQELAVRYDLNLSRLGFNNRVTLGVIGRNLITWSDYLGYDPDVGASNNDGGSAVIARFDGYQYPNFRTLTFTLEVEI